MTILQCRDYHLDLTKPQVMGILNITPDSFSDGNSYLTVDAAINRAQTMIAEGAAIIDVGGESTRPNAAAVSVQQELDRVLPVIEKLAQTIAVPISVDTSKPEVMQAAYAAGASMINDVRALTLPGAMATAASLNIPVCLMHMQNNPANMQVQPAYNDVVAEIKNFLAEQINAAMANGINKNRILVDPGFGFGKTLSHNLTLLRKLSEFQTLGCPILVGISRKAMVGQVLATPADDRLYGSLAAAIIAYFGGAIIVRAHDIKPTVQALQMAAAIAREERILS